MCLSAEMLLLFSFSCLGRFREVTFGLLECASPPATKTVHRREGHHKLEGIRINNRTDKLKSNEAKCPADIVVPKPEFEIGFHKNFTE